MKVFRIATLLGVFLILLGSSGYCTDQDKAQAPSRRKSALDDLLSIPAEALAGGDQVLEETIFNLGDIRVTGARVASPGADEGATTTPSNITVIGEKEIKDSGAVLAPLLLRDKEGVYYSDDLGQGLGARVDLRGFGGEGKQVLVLVDGARAVEPFDNSVTWSLYPSEYLRRIEVRRGGGSTVFGEGALSGSIQLKTKEPTKDFHLATENSYGSYHTQKNFVETSGTVSGVGFYVGSRYFNTDGYRVNSDHESASMLAKTQWALSEFLRAENSIYIAEGKTGIAGPLSRTEVSSDRRAQDPDGQRGDRFTDDLLEDRLQLHYDADPIETDLANLFSYRLRQQDSIQSFGGSFPGQSLNDIGTESFSDALQATREWEGESVRSRVSLGTEWEIDDIHNPFTFNDLTFGPFKSERSIDRSMNGFFAQQRWQWRERWILEYGARYDRIRWNIYDLLNPDLEKQKKADQWSPKAGIEFKLIDPLCLYADYSESFKAPDANTLIFETPNIFTPNPDIDPSTAHHHEVGFRYAHPVVGTVRADYFYIETKKEILFNDISNRNENFDTTRSGFELAGEVSPQKGLTLFANYTHTDPRFDGGDFDTKRIPLVPRTRWSGGGVYEIVKGLSVMISATGVAGQYALNDFNNIFAADDYWTLDTRVSYKKNGWELYARGENLLNREYSSFTTSDGVSLLNLNPAPELYVEGGFRWEI